MVDHSESSSVKKKNKEINRRNLYTSVIICSSCTLQSTSRQRTCSTQTRASTLVLRKPDWVQENWEDAYDHEIKIGAVEDYNYE